MSNFYRIIEEFSANWTTVLVGWIGLGPLSPWPDRWTEFPPLLTTSEIAKYAEEQLGLSSDPTEQDVLISIMSPGLKSRTREEIRDSLVPLSDKSGGDQRIELRKWRLVMLEEILENLPKDIVHGLLALTEFWQNFGFPSDSPHEVQGVGNTITSEEYFQHDNLQRTIGRYRAWIEDEKAELRLR